MGLFRHKPKEYVFSPETGCAVCKQSVEKELHHVITFLDGHTARGQVVLSVLVHHSDSCYDMALIQKMQPAGTVMDDRLAIPLDSVDKIRKKLDQTA